MEALECLVGYWEREGLGYQYLVHAVGSHL